MTEKRTNKPKWTAADRARHKAIRAEFADCPSQEKLHACGDYDGPIKGGAYFAVKTVIHELKQVRLANGLTLEAVSKHTGMDQATLSRLENGQQPNPTIDTLWRYANALGKRLVLTQVDLTSSGRTNETAAPPARKKSPRAVRAG